MPRPLLLCLLLPPLFAAQQQTSGASAAQPTFAGRSVAQWRELLSSNDLSHTDVLIAGGKDALPMLRVLIGSKEDYVPWRAIHACGEIGADAAPLADELLAILRHENDEWIKQQGAATALASIGRRDQPFVDALVAQALTSDIPALRATCVDTLTGLGIDVAARLLAAADHDRDVATDRAVELLVRAGEPSIPALIAALGAATRRREIATAALTRIGWPAVTPLERAGHQELAQRCLREGPLRHVRLHDDHELQAAGDAPFAQPALPRLPRATWRKVYGHGLGAQLWRAEEDERGLRVDVLTLTRKRSEPRTAELTAQTFSVPRARALAAMRQVAALARLHLVARPQQAGPFRSYRSTTSTGNWDGTVHVALDGDVLLDARWAGYPSNHNAAERFRCAAATGVLRELLTGCEPIARTVDDADREHLRACLAEATSTPWLQPRLQEMLDRATGR
ncbi:MAG: hypothetical protein KAI24_24150 [Planctomycetes bacterium]|nr:hypothetical protein [Planctomycetota bacterium]